MGNLYHKPVFIQMLCSQVEEEVKDKIHKIPTGEPLNPHNKQDLLVFKAKASRCRSHLKVAKKEEVLHVNPHPTVAPQFLFAMVVVQEQTPIFQIQIFKMVLPAPILISTQIFEVDLDHNFKVDLEWEEVPEWGLAVQEWDLVVLEEVLEWGLAVQEWVQEDQEVVQVGQTNNNAVD